MASETFPLIDVDRLQVGMYVVLDVGWRNHPFLRDRFTIRNAEQVAQLQGLGPKQVRWCPRRSSAQPLPEAPPAAAPGAIESSGWIPATAVWPDGEPRTEQQWQEALLKQVEDNYRQVAQRHQQMMKLLAVSPAEGRQAAEQLGDTLYRSIAEAHQPAVRLLSERVGYQASGHEVGVAALALLLARDCGFSAEAQQELALAALVHDLGKTRIPTFLHEDNGRLSDFERRTYRQHVELGVDLAKKVGLPEGVIRVIAEHHEHHDGSGFPAGRAGDRLAPASRVLAIVNRYLNLVCPLRVECGITPHQALQQMYGLERARFDPEYLSQFIRVLGVYPPGTLVELTDRRIAVVVASRPGASLSPRVQVLSKPDADPSAAAFDLDAEGELRVRCSLQPGQLGARWVQRSRQLARSPLYVEPQTASEWAAWGNSETEQVLVF